MSDQEKITKLQTLVQIAVAQIVTQMADIRQSFLIRCQTQGHDAMCNPLNIMVLQLIFQMLEELISLSSSNEDFSCSPISDHLFHASDPILQLFVDGFVQRYDLVTNLLNQFKTESDLNFLMNLARILSNLAKRLETHQRVEALEKDTECKIKNLESGSLSQTALQAAYHEKLQEQSILVSKMQLRMDELRNNVERQQNKLRDLTTKGL